MEQFNSQPKRFKYLRETVLNLTQSQLAEKLSIKQQTVADIESGRKQKIDTEILYKLSVEYNIFTDWLLFGVGDVEKSTLDAACEVNSNVVPIPFYSSKVAAGSGIEVPEYPEKDVIYFDKRWLQNVVGVKPENASIIQAEGDSMDSGLNKVNDIHDCDLLMVDNSLIEPVNNQVYVLRLGGSNKLVVKRVCIEWDGKITLSSNNKNYKDFIPPKNTVVIGKVVWNGSKENV